MYNGLEAIPDAFSLLPTFNSPSSPISSISSISYINPFISNSMATIIPHINYCKTWLFFLSSPSLVHPTARGNFEEYNLDNVITLNETFYGILFLSLFMAYQALCCLALPLSPRSSGATFTDTTLLAWPQAGQAPSLCMHCFLHTLAGWLTHFFQLFSPMSL